MKLRIHGNSLRLRVTQKEVAKVRDGGRVESSIEFAPGCSLVYLLEGSPTAETMCANFDGGAIGAGLARLMAERAERVLQMLEPLRST